MAVAKKKVTTKEKVIKKVLKETKVTVAKKADVVQATASNAATAVAVSAKVKNLSANVYDLTGKVAGKVTLAGEMFGDKVNKTLVSQAVRVYLANKRQGTVSTKTRGEVDGSTRKIYRQKGTGRARH